MFNEFKRVVVDQRLKSSFKNSCYVGLLDLPEHMKFNGHLVYYTFLRRVEPDNKLHEMWFSINDKPACFGLKKFALITGLNCGRYPRDSRYVKAMEEGEVFFKKIAKKRNVNAKRLLKLIRGGRMDKEDKFKCCLVWFVHCILLASDLTKIVDIETIKMVDNLGFFERYPWDFDIRSSAGEMRVHSYLILTVHEMKQHYMKKFKAFTDEPKDAFINGLKTHLEGVTIITSSEDGKDGDDDRNLGGNVVSRHVTRGVGTSKSTALGKTPMIKNLKERMFRLEESIKDIADFVKEERLRRAEKEKQKKRDEAEGVQVQSWHSAVRVVRDNNSIKEALLEVAAFEQAYINFDEVMIPEIAAVVEKENLDEGDEEKKEGKNEEAVCEEKNKADGSAGVQKEDHDEGRQDEDDKNEKSGSEEESNEEDGEKVEEKNAEEVEKEEGEEEHKEEGKNDAPEKKGIAKNENENEFLNIDGFLNGVTQDINKMQVEDENVECLDNI
ncbi:glutamic acid-rich protein [Capsicum annuum]